MVAVTKKLFGDDSDNETLSLEETKPGKDKDLDVRTEFSISLQNSFQTLADMEEQ